MGMIRQQIPRVVGTEEVNLIGTAQVPVQVGVGRDAAAQGMPALFTIKSHRLAERDVKVYTDRVRKTMLGPNFCGKSNGRAQRLFAKNHDELQQELDALEKNRNVHSAPALTLHFLGAIEDDMQIAPLDFEQEPCVVRHILKNLEEDARLLPRASGEGILVSRERAAQGDVFVLECRMGNRNLVVKSKAEDFLQGLEEAETVYWKACGVSDEIDKNDSEAFIQDGVS